jgi:hypothetical protein
MIELPPLPYGASPAYGYTEAEMRDYGEACARAAIEAAAKIADDLGEHYGEDGGHVADHAAIDIRRMAGAKE